MILLLAGTKDGRDLAQYLESKGFEVLATAVSAYGGNLLQSSGVEEVLAKGLSATELKKIILEKKIRAVVDATHPFAQEISRQAIEISGELALPYLRYERLEVLLPDSPLIHRVNSVEEGAKKAFSLGEKVFLTTGSKTLDIFLKEQKNGQARIIVRVLPDPKVLEKCFSLGLTPKDIVAIQGPFSKELNSAFYRQYQIDVLVTKESGLIGGVDSKIDAALDLDIPVVVIQRPKVDYPAVAQSFWEVEVFLGEQLLSC